MTPTRRTRKQQQQEEEALKKKAVESTDEESSDAGSVTRCICGEAHNVGLMVQCDKCEVWQHCECIGLIQDKLPDHYYCDQCRPENHQVIKKSNGRSKRLYNAGLVNQDSSPNNSESAGRANKRRKKTPSIAHATIISTATVTTTHTATTTTTTTTTATLSAATAAVAITTTAIHTDTIRSPKPTSSLSPLISNQHTPSIHSPSSTPPLIQDEPSRTRRTKPAEPIDESPLRKKSPSKPCHSDDSPYWNYSDGRPVRESSPPAKVRYPSSKMSFSDMHRRAKQILDCITKLKSEEPLLKQQKKEIQYLHRPRSLSISSSHSSLSTASTIPLLDECDTIPPATTQEEEEEEVDIATSVTNLLHDGSNSSISSSISSSTSIMSEDSPLTPLPFMATQIKGQESSIDILERMDQKILKFQRKFGILYQ